MSWYHRVLSQAASRRSLVGSLSVASAVVGCSLFHDDSKVCLKNKQLLWKTFTTTSCDAATTPTTKTFTAEQVSKHNGKTHPETWVSYQGKVYNITNFLKEHPGGDFIYDAAGGPIENYWAYWAYHTCLEKPISFLQQYEIGLLEQEEEEEDDDIETMTKEMYESDPDRSRSMADGQIPLSTRPWCSETHPKLLATPFTSNDAFYVRNHAPVPILDASDHDVSLECNVELQGHNNHYKDTSFDLSLESLKERFPVVTIHSILQCAGNRGGEMVQVAPTAFCGTPYQHIGTGMMGHASWTGVRLCHVLADAFPHVVDNLTEDELDALHVEFEGVDGYKVSTPLRRVLDESYDGLLAFEMNGKPLPPDHGGPLRVFLPGIAGARSCKWVHAIRIQSQECTSCFQTNYYLDMHGRPIQELPMQCFMVSKQLLKENQLHVQGVAWGGGSGVGIRRVEVSCNGGNDWKEASLQRVPRRASSSSREWSWVKFEATFDLDPNRDANAPLPKVTSRAFDGAGLQQPEKFWYPKGYLSNGWHQM